MKLLIKLIFLILILGGYIFNMYFLTVDKDTRPYQWVNKVGIVIIPLGSVMGYVYYIDKNGMLKNNDK